jgi:DNA-binding response OmpR family regulator
MPHLSGFELARVIRRRHPKLPIILSSGYIRPEDRVTADKIGIAMLLAKPTDLSTLAWAVHGVLHPE